MKFKKMEKISPSPDRRNAPILNSCPFSKSRAIIFSVSHSQKKYLLPLKGAISKFIDAEKAKSVEFLDKLSALQKKSETEVSCVHILDKNERGRSILKKKNTPLKAK
jgi:hypothetical protein